MLPAVRASLPCMYRNKAVDELACLEWEQRRVEESKCARGAWAPITLIPICPRASWQLPCPFGAPNPSLAAHHPPLQLPSSTDTPPFFMNACIVLPAVAVRTLNRRPLNSGPPENEPCVRFDVLKAFG